MFHQIFDVLNRAGRDACSLKLLGEFTVVRVVRPASERSTRAV